MLQGHQKVAKSFMAMKRYEDAAKAYAETYNHLTPDAERQLVENTLTDMLNALSNLPTGRFDTYPLIKFLSLWIRANVPSPMHK